MLLLLALGASLLTSLLQILVFTRKRTPGACIRTLLRNTLVVTLTTLAIWRFILGNPHFLKTASMGTGDFVGFSLLTLAVGLVVLFFYGISNQYLTFEEASRSHSAGATVGRILSVIAVFIGFFAIFATRWGQGEYGHLTADQIIITYISPVTGSDMVDYTNVLEGPIFSSLCCTALYGLFLFSNFNLVYLSTHKAKTVLSDLGHRVICVFLALVIFLGGLGFSFYELQAISLVRAYFSPSSFLEEQFVDPREVNLQFPEQKRNLIHIFLESVENSYMDKENGGFMEKNLIPELTEIAGEGYSFSHLPQGFGGPEPAVGTTWSVASMINMTTGLPMKLPSHTNAYTNEVPSLPGACALGDLLREQGYEQTLMFGADADYGGLTRYFTDHGSHKIMDHKFAKENGLIPPDYAVWWGFEDDKLFPMAMEELTRLSQTGKPFNFIMETADTHRPDGYLSPNAPAPYPNPYANVVAYSSSETAKFVRWIQAQPFYENTTVIITGDHVSMETHFFDYYQFPDSYRRSQYNVILNPAPGTPVDTARYQSREYGNFDFFPTILTAMGVRYDGHRLGIGTDLFSDQPTLFEEMGYRKANTQLQKRSAFYNEQILN